MFDLKDLTLLNRIPSYRGGARYFTGGNLSEIYIEEIEADDYVSQYALTWEGEVLRLVEERPDEEAFEALALPVPLEIPYVLEHPLNYKAGRLRGLREADRLHDWIIPLLISEKMAFIEFLGVDWTPMQLLGIAGSHVYTEISLSLDETLVCRQVALAYALPEIAYDKAGLPYDYQTVKLWLAHSYQPRRDDFPRYETLLASQKSIGLESPRACLRNGKRFVFLEQDSISFWQSAQS